MPLATQIRLRALTEDFGGQAKLARWIGVSPWRVSRWLRGQEPDRENRRKVEDLEFVFATLLHRYDRDTALKWLEGFNAHLANHRPVDVLARGRVTQVLRAIEAEEAGSYA